ncbi:MAG: ABC transporter permease [Promethearchaeia archaeon]
MKILKEVYISIEPVGTTLIFELKKQWKKLLVFIGMSIGFALLGSYLPYLLAPDNPLPSTITDFIQDSFSFITMIIIFSTCFFFGGIIVEEFSERTGHIVFPIINRYKILFGKYLGAFIMEILVIAAYYSTLMYLGFMYYGNPLPLRIIFSFLMAILYMLAVSAFVTMFSSFMKSISMTIVATIMILLIVNMMVDQIIGLTIPDFEQIYSLNYMSNLIKYVLEPEFPKERYVEISYGPGDAFKTKRWLTPTIETGIMIALSYFIICIIISLSIFRRKQF